MAIARRLGRGAAITLASAFLPVAAAAQSAPTDRIDAIERQIQNLQGELQRLKRELGDTKQKLRQSESDARQARAQAQQATAAAEQARSQAQIKAPPAPAGTAPASLTVASAPPTPGSPPPPHVAQTPGNRFGIESADGQNSIYLTGRLHFDVGDYFDYHPQSKFASVQNLNSGVNARRARLGVTGKFAGDWVYQLIYDFGGSADTTPGAAGSGIQSAMVTYNGLNKGPFPLAFDIGYMDTPFTLEEATSSNDIMFVERPTIQTVVSNIFANDFRSALGVRSNDTRYWAGIYVTGPQSGAAHTTGEQIGAFGRFTYQLLDGPDYSFHLGADVGGLLKPAAPGGVRSVTLSDRPEIRIDPTVILSTGALGTAANPLNNAAVYGVEGAIGYKSLFAQGEYYHIDIDRVGLPTNGFSGGYIEASWTLTGEHRKYNPATGAYGGIIPDEPFSPWSDHFGLGAFELAGRFSTISLNDNFTPGVAPAKTSNAVGGGTQTVYAAGLNWYPNANIRFMFDYLHGDINKKFSAAAGGGIAGTPLGTPIGGSFDAVILRTQFAF